MQDTRPVYIKLCNSVDVAYTVAALPIMISPNSTVQDLRIKIKLQQPNLLATIDPSRLILYANTQSQDPMGEYDKIDTLGVDYHNPAVIVIPTLPPRMYDPNDPSLKTRIGYYQQFMFYTMTTINGQNLKSPVTAYFKNMFVTFAHGFHKDLVVGAKVAIYSCVDHTPFDVIVRRVDPTVDYILMESAVPVCKADPPSSAWPRTGDQYMMIGLSHPTSDDPLSVSRGIFPSGVRLSSGHLLGSSGSIQGDSGGGVFGIYDNYLYGINVASEDVRLDETTTVKDLCKRHPSRSFIVPSIYFVDLKPVTIYQDRY